jgi:hypothetical protein
MKSGSTGLKTKIVFSAAALGVALVARADWGDDADVQLRARQDEYEWTCGYGAPSYLGCMSDSWGNYYTFAWQYYNSIIEAGWAIGCTFTPTEGGPEECGGYRYAALMWEYIQGAAWGNYENYYSMYLSS